MPEMLKNEIRKLTITLALIFIVFSGLLQAQDSAPGQKYHFRMTLEEVIETAQDQSPAALVAKHNFRSDYWQFRSYKAQFLPSLNLSANLGQYNRSLMALQNSGTGEIGYVINNNLRNRLSLSINQNITATGGTLSVLTSLDRLDQFSPLNTITYNSQPISFYYSQPIKAYNSLKWEKKIEPKRYEIAKREFLERMEDINISVTALFFEVLSAQSALEMAQKNYKTSELNAKIAQERYEIGSITNSDLLQLRLRFYNDELSISDNRLKLEMSMLKLLTYLGYNDNTEIELLMPEMGPEIQLDFNEVYTRAIENSSYDLGNELQILGAEQEVARAKSITGLQATISAQFGLTQKGNNLNSAYNNPMDQEVVGLSLTLPILDWGLGKGKVKLAKSREEVVRAQMEQAYTQHKQDILIKVMQFNRQRIQCESSSRADSIAQLRFNITRDRFQNATISPIELNTAQTEKDAAASRYISDIGNYWQYYFTLRRLTLFDFIKQSKISADFEKLIEN